MGDISPAAYVFTHCHLLMKYLAISRSDTCDIPIITAE